MKFFLFEQSTQLFTLGSRTGKNKILFVCVCDNYALFIRSIKTKSFTCDGFIPPVVSSVSSDSPSVLWTLCSSFVGVFSLFGLFSAVDDVFP